jgi:D-alanyl-D-alanine carboxypeptidase
MSKNLKYLFSALFVSLPAWWGVNVFQNNFDNYLTAQISQPLETVFPEVVKTPKPEPSLEASSALCVKIDSRGNKQTLFTKNAGTPLPIASLTKLMTALVIFNNPQIYFSSNVITISKEAAGQADTPNFGNLKAGEKYTTQELIRIMLVFSSNDAAYALAQVMGFDKFVTVMNQTATKIGLDYTYFINPSGLEPQNAINPPLKDINHSTGEELAKLIDYILLNQPEIFEITSEGQNFPEIDNGIAKLNFGENQKLIGGKTGYTDIAGGCLGVISEDKNNNKFINIVLGAKSGEDRILQMQKLIDWVQI